MAAAMRRANGSKAMSWISFSAINDAETADYISKRLGDTTVEVDQFSQSSQMSSSSRACSPRSARSAQGAGTLLHSPRRIGMHVLRPRVRANASLSPPSISWCIACREGSVTGPPPASPARRLPSRQRCASDLFAHHGIRPLTLYDIRRMLGEFLDDNRLGGAASTILGHKLPHDDMPERERMAPVSRDSLQFVATLAQSSGDGALDASFAHGLRQGASRRFRRGRLGRSAGVTPARTTALLKLRRISYDRRINRSQDHRTASSRFGRGADRGANAEERYRRPRWRRAGFCARFRVRRWWLRAGARRRQVERQPLRQLSNLARLPGRPRNLTRRSSFH